jgi:tetratricopeptide (TPR) repeat protein
MKITSYIILLLSILIHGCGTTKQVATPAATPSAKTKLSATYFEANKARLQKESSKAKQGYLEEIKFHPDNASAHYYYAKIKMNESDAADALPYAKKATELFPDNKYYSELYADVLASTNNARKAIEIYKQLAKSDVKLAEKYLRKALYYQTDLQLNEDALITFNELEKYYGIDPELTFKKIAILKKQKKLEEVINEANKLIADDPQEIKYYLFKVVALEEAKQTEKSKEFYAFVEKKFENDARLLPHIVLKALDEKDTTRYLSLLAQCMQNKALEPEEKLSLLQPMIEIARKDSTILSLLSTYGSAMIAATPDDEKAIQFYASILNTTKEYDKAVVQYYKLLSKNAKEFNTWQQLFFIYANQQKNDSLIAITKKAMDYFPTNALVYYMNGSGQLQNQNFPGAIKSLLKAVDFSEGNNDLKQQAYSQLGDAYQSTKEYKKSDSSFYKALAIVPNDATVLNNFAYYLSLRNERLEEAAKMSEKSLVLRKGEKSFLDTYAWILFKQEKFAEAESKMQEALAATGKNDAAMLEHYGDILIKLGNKEKAKTYWQQAKQLGLKNETLDKKIANGAYYE